MPEICLKYALDVPKIGLRSEVQIVWEAGKELPSRIGDQQQDFKGKSRDFSPE